MQLEIIVQLPQHTDSRRMHPTTQMNTPNLHIRGTPESSRCSSNLLPRECSRSCFGHNGCFGNRWITRWHLHRKIYRHSHVVTLWFLAWPPLGHAPPIHAGFDGGQVPWQPHALPQPPCAYKPVTLCSSSRCLSHISLFFSPISFRAQINEELARSKFVFCSQELD